MKQTSRGTTAGRTTRRLTCACRMPLCLPTTTPPQVLLHSVAALKGGAPAHFRGCSKADLLELIGRDARRLYLVLHNIDGPGACVRAGC